MLTNLAPLLIYLVALPVMIVTIFKVEVGILFFILIVPVISVMKKIVQYPAGNQFADLLLISILLGWGVRVLREKKRIFMSSPLNLVVILIMFGSIINLICSFTFAGSSEEIDLLKTWKNYMILPLIYFIAVNNIDEENLVKKIIICICFTMLAMDFNFYTTFKWLKQYHYSDSMRISGAFSFLGPNELSIFYNMYTFLLLGIFYFIEEKKIKYLILFVCACNCYPILFSFSRTGYMCAIAGLLTLGLLKDRKFLVLLVALIICYRFVLPQAVVERIDMTFLEKDNISQEEQQSSAFDVGGTTLEITGRKHLWEKAMNYFEKEPLLGIGFDNFRRQEGWITHSLYMRILAEQGLIGATIFIVFITTILWQSLRLFRHSKSKLGQGIGLGFLISIIVHLVGSATGDQSLYYNLMAIFWLFMGIVASLRKYGSSNSNNKGCQIDPLEP